MTQSGEESALYSPRGLIFGAENDTVLDHWVLLRPCLDIRLALKRLKHHGFRI